MGAELTTFQQASLDDRWRYAQAIAQAGNLVPKGLREDDGAMNPGKVLMAMEQAAVLGFAPIVGVNSINVIDGKVSIPPALMQAAVRRAGHKLRVKVEGTVEGGDIRATATLVRSDDPDYEFTAVWTPQRAHRAGLCTYTQEGGVWRVIAESKYGKALPWQSYTEALLKARAISEVCMEGATDVLMGTYTPEELGADVDAAGEVIEPRADDIVQNHVQQVTSAPETGEHGRAATETPAVAVEAVLERPGDDGDDAAAAWADAVSDADLPMLRTLWDNAQQQGLMGLVLEGGVSLRDAMTARGNLLTAEQPAQEAPEGGDDDGNQ